MNQQQIAYAAKHDWFIDATENSVIVQESYVNQSGEYVDTEIEFTDFNALMVWAGY